MNDQTENPKQAASRTRFWRTHIKAMAQSGLSRAEYCRRCNLSYYALVYWQRKLARPSSNQMTLVPVALSAVRKSSVTDFDPAPLKILLPGNLAIAVGDNFSGATLNRLLGLLENR